MTSSSRSAAPTPRPVQEGRFAETSCQSAATRRDVVPVGSSSTDLIRVRMSTYSARIQQISIGVLLPPNLWEDRRLVSLRLAPARNNQLRGINRAKDFEIAATLRSFGA